MKQIDEIMTDSHRLNIMQKRSKKTYDAFIKTGFRLLKKLEWDSITVARLSQSAGYSVGAFYRRFRSKDEFFNALVIHQLEARWLELERLSSMFNNSDFIDELIKYLVHYHWKNINYCRAAQLRGMSDPEFWMPLRKRGHDVANKTIAKLSELANRPLTDSEEINVRFAFQITIGTIKNTLINNPGPILINHKLFLEKLTQAFRLVSNCDNFITKKKSKK